MLNRPRPTQPGPNQESVWDYPRPPRLEIVSQRIQVFFNGLEIVDTCTAIRVLETSHPPNYYIPPGDLAQGVLRAVSGGSLCEWKGSARYFDVAVGDQVAPRGAWSYPNPTRAYQSIRDHVALYAGPMDACLVNGERVRPQPGGFYGGWITDSVVGPFKGEPGTEWW